MTAMLAVVERSTGMSDDTLDRWLHKWTEWMLHRGNRVGRGYPSVASGGIGVSHGGGYSVDFDGLCEGSDNYFAQGIDAAIEDLPQPQRIAVHHRLLASVYRGRFDIEEQWQMAREALKQNLPKKGID